jgi:ABC-type lipoprotein export system ATPase subunit
MSPESAPKPGTISSEPGGVPVETDGHAVEATLSSELSSPSLDGARLDGDGAQSRIVVQVRGLTRVYGSDPPVHALQNVDLTIYAGEWVAIIGPSGSGKSTLLNILGCLDRPTAGSYHIDGIEAARLSDEERAAVRARRIGFVFQTFHLLGHRTALENVMLAEVYSGGERVGRRERAIAALERVGMGHRCDFLPTKLSGGEQQRVAIARALLASPKLLLCDEPTGNLDSANTEALLALFEELGRDGLTLVVITHEEDVAAHAKRIVRMVDGHLTEVTR